MHLISTIFVGVCCAAMALADCCDAECDCEFDPGPPPAEICDKCYEGTEKAPCCGKGSCNIVCCNCDDGPASSLYNSVQAHAKLYSPGATAPSKTKKTYLSKQQNRAL